MSMSKPRQYRVSNWYIQPKVDIYKIIFCHHRFCEQIKILNRFVINQYRSRNLGGIIHFPQVYLFSFEWIMFLWMGINTSWRKVCRYIFLYILSYPDNSATWPDPASCVCIPARPELFKNITTYTRCEPFF